MMITNKVRLGSMLLVLGWCSLIMPGRGQPNPPAPSVNPGSENNARTYYKRVSRDLQFLTPDTILNSGLDDFLEYLGYKGLHAVDLDKLDSDVLMDYDKLKAAKLKDPAGFAAQFHSANDLPKGNILVSRFFAPKITDDSHLPPNAYGWRKLIRLLPNGNTGSPMKKSVLEAFVLFNYFQPDLSKSPFDSSNDAVNIQIALVSTPEAIKQKHDPLYWLDYATGYGINFFLDAFFDARDPVLPKKKYFIPDACAACHGNIKKPLLNYLDTDHWIDRAQGNDFSNFGASTWPVLFDAGTRDESTPQYKAAFDTIRKVNTEIRDQNVNTVARAFQTAASKNWVNRHATSVFHLQPIDRPIPAADATKNVVWTKGNPDDEKILPLLNQYCFRCHGSVKFNVFDKGSVTNLERASKILTRIKFDPAAHPTMERRVGMPPDREIPAADKAAILKYITNLLK